MVTENGVQSDGNTSFLRAARSGNLDKVLEHLKNNVDINTCNANGLNALHLASKDGHVHIVSELLKRGAAVDNSTKKGNSALHIASLAGQEEVVKLLLQYNASVNAQSQNGFTPLYMASQENHDSVVKLLLASGANQSLATEDGFTPLLVAMQQGHDKVVAVLLESDTRGRVRLPALHIAAKKDDVRAATLLLENDHNPDVTSKSGFTPLHIASHYGNEAIANLLIQKGADVNFPAKHNITPLHVSCKWGKSNMVSLLLEKGANIESKTRDGLTPLHCSARSGHEQVVDMLLERGAPISAKTKNGLAPLHMSAQGEHVDAARILLYHRAPVDEVTVDYLTALHVAAHCGHVRVAKLLLDRNADANARALNGFTPLHIACKKNRIKVVELLLKHGASISATTESGLTPLHVASFMGCMNIVIYLLQNEASPDQPTCRGETPLHLACRANQTDIIRILLRNGAQVDARAREQQTALHIASRLGNVDIVMLLLQHGAQVDNTTRDMYTALHIAAKEGQDEVVAVLIDNGASLEASTKKGFQPLHLAAKYGHMKVAELLLQKGAPVDAQGKNGVTPLHVSAHYDHQNVALLLLNKGASPEAIAKNGHTALHISARKNQMDIAATLLEYGAQADSESRAGFTPLHLSSQEGHVEMSNLLLEHKANSNHQAKNGLTPLHLCAQEDRTNVAKILIENGANVNAKTKNANTALHIASHFGQLNMVKFLLQNGANVNADSALSMTPLHQAAQQGHLHIVNVLLEYKANPDAVTSQGQTPLNISQKLGYISVVESLKNVTQSLKDQMQTSTNEGEKYRVVAPEAMHETFMSDSEEEGGDDVNTDHPYRYLTVDEMKSLGDDSLPIDVTRDERIDSNRMAVSTDSNNMYTSQNEDIITPQHVTQTHVALDGKYAIDNIKIERHPEQIGKLHWKNFLVSFLVDARGGAMRGCRHSGIRIIVPPRSCAMPTRITCRYVKPQRTLHPPQLMEGEALASRVLELGPGAAKFIGPVIMEVPHFASLRGKEREIVILRSDNGETWREHQVENSDEIIHDTLNEYFEPGDINQMDESSGGRICRFVTYDFPQYFAVVSRIRQEFIAIGPDGGMVSSTVIPTVQAIFPQGALTKKIKVGLQAQPIDPDLTAKLLGRGVAVSPIVTVEPRRRKFHKAITLSMPAPKAHSQGMINQYSGNAPTLRLLCSITGGPSRAQWEDVTGSTPLTFVNDCVSFTTTVSARFWLMDCRNISEATKMATDLYREAIHVPFMAKFVVFAKRVDPFEARLRVFCMTDDKEDKTLEYQEHFTEVAKSRDVEVLEGKPQYTEFAGNLVPVTKSGEQLQIHFKAFRENRLPFNVRVKDQHADTVGRALFMREPRVAKGEQPQQPICILNIVLPEQIYNESVDDNRDLKHRNDRSNLNNIRIVDISNLLGQDWIRLAPELGFAEQEVNEIIADNPTSTPRQAQSMLQNYISREDSNRTVLETSLRSIKRDDIIKKCLRLSLCVEKLKPSASGTRKGSSFDNGYEEADNMKDSESVEELTVHEREELKYSAEEKIVEDSDDESQEDEIVERSVAERREQITKRLSIERPIPASTQQKEIVQEVAEIKRRSLIEDKKALHEEEINMHAPTDNIIKSATIPEPVKKLKSGIKDDVDVTKSDFDKELQDKLKITIKDSESFEHKVSSDLTENISRADEKVQIDTVTTEKPHKKNADTLTASDTIEINAEATSSADFADKVETIKELFDHEKIEAFVEPVITTKILETTISTKNFLNNEVTVQSELHHVVTQQDLKKADGIQNTTKTTIATETAISKQECTEPIKFESHNDGTVKELTTNLLQGDDDADDFYKTIEEKITKKMSQDFTIHKNDDIRDESDEILVSQTPPPTPNETNQQQNDVHKDLHYVESPPKPKQLEDDLNDAASKNESRSLIAPKPTPRSFKPISYDTIASKAVDVGHTAPIGNDDNGSCTAIDRSSGDFSETKQFWQSLESSSIDDSNIPPIPKPRSQSQVQSTGFRTIDDDFDAGNKDNITLNERNISQTSFKNIDLDQHNVSITDQLLYKEETRSDHNDIIFHSPEQYSTSIYNFKERENILDDEDFEDVSNERKAAAFYIGESSGNLITKSAIEKRLTFPYDNDCKELKDTIKLNQKTEIECSDHTCSEVRFNLHPEEIGVASYGKDDDITVNLQQTGMDKSLEEKCETEMSEKVILQRNETKKCSYKSENPFEQAYDQTECSKTFDTNLEKITTDFLSKIEAKGSAELYEYTIPTYASSSSQEIEKNIDEEESIQICEPVKMAESTLFQTDLIIQKMTDSVNKVQIRDEAANNVDQDIEEDKIAINESEKMKKIQFEGTELEHRDIIEPKTTLVVHSPVDNLEQGQYIEVDAIKEKNIQKQKFEKFFIQEDNMIDYSLDSDKQKIYPAAHMNELLKQEFNDKMETRAGEVIQKQPTDDSSLTTSKSEVIHRTGSSKVTSKTRWSFNDPDHSSPSSYSVDNSRPCSSDVENLYVSYPNSSGEYQTALDASSLIPGSTEYHTAVSSFDNSGKTISSEESMKSFDSESSSNLGSIEVSDASETLVPSTADLEFDENEHRLSSLHTVCDIILDAENALDSDGSAGPMKRSHEMIFAHSIENIELSKSVDMSESNRKVNEEEFNVQQFSTNLGDASNLSISFSTTSNADTIIENVQEDMASSYDAGSLVGSYERKASLINEISSPQEKFPHAETYKNSVMVSTIIEDNISSINTSITSDNEANDIMVEIDDMTPRRSKGHKRNDSTSFLSGIDMAKLSQDSTDSSSFEEEMIIHDAQEDERKESGSDSEYDRYETEYSRSFKKPGMQRKKKAMSPKSAQKPEQEQTERKKSIPNIETIVEVSEDIVDIEKLRSRGISQNMHDYSQIPNITITDDPTKYVSDDEDSVQEKQEPITVPTKITDKAESEISNKSDAMREETQISQEEYEKLIERQYKSQEDPYESKADSEDLCDSFELVEQPDISDEFVIIEEVAREANELMTEGKSVSIQQTKYVKKHDDEVEKIIIKSAPAATNEGSTLLQGRHDLAFEFEESPPSGANTESSEDGAGIESSRKWIEMQLAEQAQNLRYPYDIDRGALEDIKEEDTDFEIGSSRISSFKDSYSSNDFEVAGARRYQTKDHDNVSVNSLQEFERLEQAISLENKKTHSNSNGSFSNGSFPKRGLRTAQADEISLCSLQDFEGLENACFEATLLELKAKEEHALLLSRSDESNKSGKLDDCGTTITEQTTTVYNKIESLVTTGPKSKNEQEEDISSSYQMEVSTDSLDAKQIKQLTQSKNASQHDSSDSLEMSRSADIMTSSIDSIEISKDGATAKTSKSECDSIEQNTPGEKRDSIESVDAQYAVMTQSLHIQSNSVDANLLDLSSSAAVGGYETKTVIATSVASSGYGGCISKDISSDSLNLNPEPELLLTSTESLDNTCSTFATYQSQIDSQMTMSGSLTSCDSNTLVDCCETINHNDSHLRSTSNMMPDNTTGTLMTPATDHN